MVTYSIQQSTKPNVHFLVTCAYNITGLTQQLCITRNKEYNAALQIIFSAGLPVYGVHSEMTPTEYEPPSFTVFPYIRVKTITSTAEKYRAISKSQKEFCSIYESVSMLDQIPDSDWIIKMSGRYIFVNDEFIKTVQEQPDSIHAVIKTCDDNKQCYTFCFAIRKKLFQEFFSNFNHFHTILNKNIENVLYEYLINNYSQHIKNVDVFYIYADIDNSGQSKIY